MKTIAARSIVWILPKTSGCLAPASMAWLAALPIANEHPRAPQLMATPAAIAAIALVPSMLLCLRRRNIFRRFEKVRESEKVRE